MFHEKTAKSSARVVDGNLIISMPDAKNPAVWRMALGEARAAALEVTQKNDSYMLVLKYPKGEVIDIAPFDKKEAAIHALMAVSHAMQNARGQIRSSAGSAMEAANNNRPLSLGWKWLIPLALIVVAIFVFGRTPTLMPADYETDAGTDQATVHGTAATENSDNGVPVSADNILNGM